MNEYCARKEEEMKERITICRLSSKGRVRERETKRGVQNLGSILQLYKSKAGGLQFYEISLGKTNYQKAFSCCPVLEETAQ